MNGASDQTTPGSKIGTSGGPLYLRDFMAFKDKTMEEKIQELADREEIRELIARYSHKIAHGYSVDDLFTDDGVFILRVPGKPIRETKSRQAIAALYAKWVPGRLDSPKPMSHNQLLVIHGDEAAGLCSNEVRMTADGQSLIGSAYFEDRFRRENGRWKFTVRDSTFFHLVPIQQGWASPEAAV
jgi:SnoaL-like domain